MQKPGIDPLARSESRTRRLANAERVWTIVLIVVAAMVTLCALVLVVAPSPTFCGACHAVETKALASSAHRGIRCDECHTGASGFGFVQSRLSTIDMVTLQFLPGPKRVIANIDSRRCVMCHQKDIAQTSTGGRVRMSHKTPIEKGWTCDQCHVSVAHSRVAYARIGYTMDTCMQCHSTNSSDISGCETCHAGETGGNAARSPTPTPWRVTHGSNWQQTHGMGDLTTCKACHLSNYCVRCHNLNVPHPEDYLAMHGLDVLGRATRSRDCIVCHKVNSCDNCHGIPMPHPSDFLQDHKAEAQRLGQKACERCHDHASCDACHKRHIHPGLPVKQREYLQARPVD